MSSSLYLGSLTTCLWVVYVQGYTVPCTILYLCVSPKSSLGSHPCVPGTISRLLPPVFPSVSPIKVNTNPLFTRDLELHVDVESWGMTRYTGTTNRHRDKVKSETDPGFDWLVGDRPWDSLPGLLYRWCVTENLRRRIFTVCSEDEYEGTGFVQNT